MPDNAAGGQARYFALDRTQFGLDRFGPTLHYLPLDGTVFRESRSVRDRAPFVASGRVDAYFESGGQDWDITAGGLIVREAGGVTLDHRSDGGPYVAAAPGLLEPLAAAIGIG